MKTTYLTALSWLRLAGEFLETYLPDGDFSYGKTFIHFLIFHCLRFFARAVVRKENKSWVDATRWRRESRGFHIGVLGGNTALCEKLRALTARGYFWDRDVASRVVAVVMVV